VTKGEQKNRLVSKIFSSAALVQTVHVSRTDMWLTELLHCTDLPYLELISYSENISDFKEFSSNAKDLPFRVQNATCAMYHAY